MLKIYSKIENSTSIYLDLARAIAAALVVLMHVRVVFFEPYVQLNPDSQTALNYLLFFVTRLGHEAVIIFFVLSGYLVGGSLLVEVNKGVANYTKYFVNRLTRMWVVLIPALILGGMFDLYSASLNPQYSWLIGRVNLNYFLGNVFFLQEVLVPTFGSNGPLWSIANEFWYYAIWPFLLIIVFVNYNWKIKTVVFIAFILGLSFLIPKIMFLFPIWIGGALLRLVKDHPVFQNKYLYVFSLALLFASLALSNILENYLGDYILGIVCSVVILFWQYSKQTFHPLTIKTASFFSNFSFSLYAVHYFLMILILQLLYKYFNIPFHIADASLANWLLYTAICISIFILSWVFYKLTESHTPKVRKFTYQVVSKLMDKAGNK